MYRSENTDRGITVYVNESKYNGYGDNESIAGDAFAISLIIGFVIFLLIL
jgi:hypothetical protein